MIYITKSDKPPITFLFLISSFANNCGGSFINFLSALYSFKRGGRAPSAEGKYRKRVVYKNFLLTDV